MNKRQWISVFVAFVLIQYFAVIPLTARAEDAATTAAYKAYDIALTPGADSSQLNIAWYTTDKTPASVVEIKENPPRQTGNNGWGNARQFRGTSLAPGNFVLGSADGTGPSNNYNEVTVTGLKPQIEYLYRLGNGKGSWSTEYKFKTADVRKFGFIYLSDVQIGASGNAASDTAGWANTLATIGQNFPETAFILSAGDQVDAVGNPAQWDAFFSPAALTSLPMAPTIASHDELGIREVCPVATFAFDYHFKLPNEGAHLPLADKGNSCTSAAGDYYFTYGKALFMVLNLDSNDYAAHQSFMKAAITASPEAKWKIVMFHYTLYTAAGRPVNEARKNAMYPLLQSLEIDAVLTGHDHTYCRTYQMLDDKPQKTQPLGADGRSVINPTGVLYLVANSSSGSKFYDLASALPDYVAKAYQDKKNPGFQYITVDDNKLVITSYIYAIHTTMDTISGKSTRTYTPTTIDSYTMVKVSTVPPK